jgi:hypothetical protein
MLLFAGLDDGTIHAVSMKAGIPIRVYSGHKGRVLTLIALDSQASFLSGSADGTVRQWSIESTEEGDGGGCTMVYAGHSGPVYSLQELGRRQPTVSRRQGEFVLSSGEDEQEAGSVRADAENGSGSSRNGGCEIGAAKFVSGGQDCCIQLWESGSMRARVLRAQAAAEVATATQMEAVFRQQLFVGHCKTIFAVAFGEVLLPAFPHENVSEDGADERVVQGEAAAEQDAEDKEPCLTLAAAPAAAPAVSLEWTRCMISAGRDGKVLRWRGTALAEFGRSTRRANGSRASDAVRAAEEESKREALARDQAKKAEEESRKKAEREERWEAEEQARKSAQEEASTMAEEEQARREAEEVQAKKQAVEAEDARRVSERKAREDAELFMREKEDQARREAEDQARREAANTVVPASVPNLVKLKRPVVVFGRTHRVSQRGAARRAEAEAAACSKPAAVVVIEFPGSQ